MAFSAPTLLSPTIIAKEALMSLTNHMVMGGLVHRGYEDELRKPIGGILTIRKPNKFQVTKQRTRVTSFISEKSITLEVATQAHVSWEFTMASLATTIEKYKERYIEPAAAELANVIDLDLCALYDDIANQVEETSSWNSNPASFLCLGKAAQKMDEEAVPQQNRVLVLNPAANWSLANALRTVYVVDIAKPALRKGYLATIAGMEIFMDQNINVHTTGDWHFDTNTTTVVHQTAAMTSKTTNDTISIIGVGRTASEAFKVGDVFSIAGVYAVNPMSKVSTGTLRQFVVTADASCIDTTFTSLGLTLLYISPALVHTGPDKNVDTLPAGAAAIFFQGNIRKNQPMNLAFHKNAFALVMVPLAVPDGAWGHSMTHAGISIRVYKGFNIDSDIEAIRMDILYGVKTLYPELACRVMGAEASASA